MKMLSRGNIFLILTGLFFFLVVLGSLGFLFRPNLPLLVKAGIVGREGSAGGSEGNAESAVENSGSQAEPEIKANEPKLTPQSGVLNPNETFNVLVLGIDRRYQTEESYRSDVMMVITVFPKAHKVLMTSIPRDLWAGNMKINGIYVSQGYDAMKAKVKEITGLDVDRFIRIDFDALVWVVDAMGGVDVNVERSFTDNEYPNDRQGDANQAVSVSFTQGTMHLDGETALVYSRSRHGDNGEGSDFGRMQRQQVLLVSMPEAFLSQSSKNIFNPFVLQSFYNLITQHIKTDMNVSDVGVIYDLLKNRNSYSVEHFVVDYNYLVNPPISDYGQWVLIPKNNDYTPIHQEIQTLLSQ